MGYTLKELARSYLTISKDLTRVMNRVKALYRSWGIACEGQQVYAPRHRAQWLQRTGDAGVQRRAELWSTVCSSFRTRAALQLEILALRHQINVLRRSQHGCVRLRPVDRFLWTWLLCLWPS